MEKLARSFILGFVLALLVLPSLDAQTASSVPAASPTPTGQAPDAVMKKLSELVHEGKYAEAQQLTAGLLMAYPEDQRLIKAKALLDKSLANAAATTTTPGSNPAVTHETSTQTAANEKGDVLTGMEKVDYNALIILARQAQQNTDLEQQKASLNQFMDQSNSFLQKHPTEMLLWQLRAASAISLNDPMAGYDAGQKLLAAGAADSTDANSQQLLAQLKNKGWLEKIEATKQAKDAWILGTWSLHFSYRYKSGELIEADNKMEFSRSDSVFQGYSFKPNGEKKSYIDVEVTILDSGEIRCVDRWKKPVQSCEIADHNRTMKIVLPPTKYVGVNTWKLQKQ